MHGIDFMLYTVTTNGDFPEKISSIQKIER